MIIQIALASFTFPKLVRKRVYDERSLKSSCKVKTFKKLLRGSKKGWERFSVATLGCVWKHFEKSLDSAAQMNS